MQIHSLGKNPNSYESVWKETNIYEQKPIEIDDFNDLEEAEVKKWVNKRKMKQRKIAENNKLLKKKNKKMKKIKLKKKICGSALAN